MAGHSDTASDLHAAATPSTRSEPAGKRVLDLGIAVFALILVAPIMVCVVLAIKLTDRGPVLFRQQRVGLRGQKFSCFKFRTMAVDSERALADYLAANEQARREWESSQKLTIDPRITRIGRFLRRSSLDELPQLFNVIVGDMSIVGPRPIVPAEMSRYGQWIGHYLSVRPGVTGLWQVSGRSTCSYPERVAFDVKYVEEGSIRNDLLIICKTVPAVLLQRGSC